MSLAKTHTLIAAVLLFSTALLSAHAEQRALLVGVGKYAMPGHDLPGIDLDLQTMRETLNLAIESGGSSISDYIDANGRRGTFQFHHQVYGKAGAPCPRCTTPIRRTVIAQRGTQYCPRCQR